APAGNHRRRLASARMREGKGMFTAIIMLASSVLPAAEPLPADRFVVRIAAEDKRLVRVEAEFALDGDTVIMCPEGANQLPEKWATFVRSLAGADKNGKPVALSYAGGATWKVAAPAPKRVRLSYEVLIHHDERHWPFGNKEAAYVRKQCLF